MNARVPDQRRHNAGYWRGGNLERVALSWQTVVLASLSVGIVVLSACRDTPNDLDDGTVESGLHVSNHVVVIAHQSDEPFHIAFRAGAEAAIEQEQLPVDWREVSPHDVQGQLKAIERATEENCAGICICPADPTSLVPAVLAAVQADIPVVVCGTPLDGGPDTVAVVGTDHFQCGRLAGQEIAQRVNGQGHVLVVPAAAATHETSERQQGLLFALSKYSDIDVVRTDDAQSHGDGSPAKTVWETRLQDGDIAAICGLSTAVTRMVCESPMLRDAQSNCHVVGFGAWPQAATALREGRLAATVVQHPYLMGNSMIVVMANQLRGNDVGRLITTGEILVNSDNVDSPQTLKLLDENIGATDAK